MIVSLMVVFAGLSAMGEDLQGHPRRKQVVRREEREKAKNNAAAVQGKITDQQAQKLDRQDNAIRREEKRDAAEHGGHITKAEQNKMNRQENRVNAERNAMEKKDAAAAPAAPATPAAPAPTTGN